MNIKQITKAARTVHRLIDGYSSDSEKKREMRQDPLLFGFFEARFGKMSRQKHIFIGPGAHPKRVDFRHGGQNPALIEFAVRPPDGWAELYGTANKDELNKLTRFPTSKAKLRVLLLFDFVGTPIRKEKLKESFDRIRSSRGKYRRYAVQVIYVHGTIAYGFRWTP